MPMEFLYPHILNLVEPGENGIPQDDGPQTEDLEETMDGAERFRAEVLQVEQEDGKRRN